LQRMRINQHEQIRNITALSGNGSVVRRSLLRFHFDALVAMVHCCALMPLE
jgi:hypothetical protein